MSRKMFEQSAETKAIVDLFKSLRYGEEVSFETASKSLRFRLHSSSPAYAQARRIAERDHGVYIYAVRGVGFGRGNGSAMVASGAGMFERIRKIGKRTANRMLNAINENLSDDEHRQAMDYYARANIVTATSSKLRASSNRKKRDVAERADPFDLGEALRLIKASK